MKIPDYVLKNTGCESSRKFKSMKRKQAKKVREELNELMRGCAYFPKSSDDVNNAIDAVNLIIEDLSVKNWGN